MHAPPVLMMVVGGDYGVSERRRGWGREVRRRE
jgi:hypothetical protein